MRFSFGHVAVVCCVRRCVTPSGGVRGGSGIDRHLPRGVQRGTEQVFRFAGAGWMTPGDFLLRTRFRSPGDQAR